MCHSHVMCRPNSRVSVCSRSMHVFLLFGDLACVMHRIGCAVTPHAAIVQRPPTLAL